MYCFVSEKKLRDPRYRLMLDREYGETWESHVWTNRVRVDAWAAIRRRFPSEPWRHMSGLYGRHAGETCLITGCGPSLKLLKERPAYPCIAINRSVLHYKPDYWLASDAYALAEAMDHPHAEAADWVMNIQLHDCLIGRNAWLVELNPKPGRWPYAASRPLYWNETTLGWAIHLAIRMGFQKIITLGTELSLEGHFDGSRPDGRDDAWQRIQLAGVRGRMELMFSADELAHWKDREVEILDASGGMLPVPKVEWDEVR